MINEISPYKFYNDFQMIPPKEGDYLLCYQNNMILLLKENDRLVFPKIKDLNSQYRFLFRIDDFHFYLGDYSKLSFGEEYAFYPLSLLREYEPMYLAYAGVVGRHLHTFFYRHQHCGICGEKTIPSHTEQAVTCPKCGNIIYPCVMPAIVVRIEYKDKTLLTKYLNATAKNYVLVAGYVEFGESLEEAVKREVKEEVGLDVYDIKYYKNQPWGFTNTLMVGFTCKATCDKITLQVSELKEATWFKRDEIKDNVTLRPNISLTHELINNYIKGE